MNKASELELLQGMARCFEDNTGKPPTTVKELTNHWYDMSNDVVVMEHIDEDGRHHPAETLIEVDDKHMGECIWLRTIEQRPDADALLADAVRGQHHD